MVKVTRKSILSGTVNEMTFNVSHLDFDLAMERYENGALLQDAFHFLNADEREFVKTGITPAEWNALFGPEEDA